MSGLIWVGIQAMTKRKIHLKTYQICYLHLASLSSSQYNIRSLIGWVHCFGKMWKILAYIQFGKKEYQTHYSTSGLHGCKFANTSTLISHFDLLQGTTGCLHSHAKHLIQCWRKNRQTEGFWSYLPLGGEWSKCGCNQTCQFFVCSRSHDWHYLTHKVTYMWGRDKEKKTERWLPVRPVTTSHYLLIKRHIYINTASYSDRVQGLYAFRHITGLQRQKRREL